MADEFRSNMHFRGAGGRYLLAVAALIVLSVLGLMAARVRPGYKYVSLINQGQVQVCRVTPDGPICPPLSSSLSKSASVSKSKSFSPSKSISTSTSLVPPSKSSSTSMSLSSSTQ